MPVSSALQTSPSEPFLPWGLPRADAQVRVFCVPYAGGGATVFHAMRAALPREVDLCPLQLPGREERLSEPPLTCLAQLSPKLLAVLEPFLGAPFALLGYSMGAIVAYDLARRLSAAGTASLRHLVVCARRNPLAPSPWRDSAQESDEGMIARLKTLGGTPDEVFAHPDLLALIVATLRADFQINDSLEEAVSTLPTLSCPVTAIGGLGDSHVTTEDLEAWQGVTTGRFQRRSMPGGHFFIREKPAEFARVVARAVLSDT